MVLTQITSAVFIKPKLLQFLNFWFKRETLCSFPSSEKLSMVEISNVDCLGDLAVCDLEGIL